MATWPYTVWQRSDDAEPFIQADGFAGASLGFQATLIVTPATATFLADAVLIVHVTIAFFVVAGLVFIIVGNLAHWRLANNLWFRLAHLTAIAIVVAESWLGIVCPLTTLEMALRAQAGVATYSGGFIEHWVGGLLFYNAPAWVFVAAYSIFGLLVAASWWLFPPKAWCPRRKAG